MYISAYQNGKVKKLTKPLTKKEILESTTVYKQVSAAFILKQSKVELNNKIDYLQEDAHNYSIVIL